MKEQKTKSWRGEGGMIRSKMMNSAGGLIKGQSWEGFERSEVYLRCLGACG